MSPPWIDPVVEEVRERGRAYTARFGHDIRAIMEDLRQHERQHPERYVSQITVISPHTPEQRGDG